MVAATAAVMGAIVAEVGAEAVPQVLRGDRALQDQGKVGKEDERLHRAAAQPVSRRVDSGLSRRARAPLHARARQAASEKHGRFCCACARRLSLVG